MPVKEPLAKTNENYNLIGNTKVRLVNELVFTVKHNKKKRLDKYLQVSRKKLPKNIKGLFIWCCWQCYEGLLKLNGI